MTSQNIVKPEDMLPDNVDVGTWKGVEVRKGTIAAFIENARALNALEPGIPAYDEIVTQLRATVPSLEAVGLFEIFELRSPRLRELLGK
ncbi:hypothetical protein ACQP2X_17455 [Actinoplanes sp. CA-131856]